MAGKGQVEGKKRVNLYISDHIVEKLDEYAKDLGINRSAMVSVILKQYIDQQEVLKMTSAIDLLEQLESKK